MSMTIVGDGEVLVLALPGYITLTDMVVMASDGVVVALDGAVVMVASDGAVMVVSDLAVTVASDGVASVLGVRPTVTIMALITEIMDSTTALDKETLLTTRPGEAIIVGIPML